VTTLAVPELQRFVVGAELKVPPLAEPQTPLGGRNVNVTVTVQFAVIGLVV
jgi:hypothetical protein